MLNMLKIMKTFSVCRISGNKLKVYETDPKLLFFYLLYEARLIGDNDIMKFYVSKKAVQKRKLL